MTITLGGIAISDNMYLEGIETAKTASVSQIRTVSGTSYVMAKATPGGKTLSLGTTSQRGAVQGIWCQSVLDSVKALQALAQEITLNYHGDVYSVMIVDTSDMKQLDNRTPITEFKKYLGSIILIQT